MTSTSHGSWFKSHGEGRKFQRRTKGVPFYYSLNPPSSPPPFPPALFSLPHFVLIYHSFSQKAYPSCNLLSPPSPLHSSHCTIISLPHNNKKKKKKNPTKAGLMNNTPLSSRLEKHKIDAGSSFTLMLTLLHTLVPSSFALF